MFNRNAKIQLNQWKSRQERRPLILRGARQVGKSTLIESWGKAHFQHFLKVDLEQQRDLHQLFSSSDPQHIISILTLSSGVKLDAPGAMLFIDEIQECPTAIHTLRYFYEQMPNLAVVAAGSLLEQKIRAEQITMPVGRVEFLHLYPLSFGEFLQAIKQDQLADYLGKFTFTENMDLVLHERLLELFKNYCLVGGMPAVVREYCENPDDWLRCQQIQSFILQTYYQDFGKYSSMASRKYLEAVFDFAPKLVGQKIVYRNIHQQYRSADLRTAIDLLTQVGFFHEVKMSKATATPLAMQVKANFFKLVMLDTGLWQNKMGISSLILGDGLLDIYRGALAEQVVAQELIAAKPNFEPAQIYYWAREAKNSNAEVDYLIDLAGIIFPIEVKSGNSGRMKSLKLFLEEKKLEMGIRLGPSLPKRIEQKIITLPIYCAGYLENILKSI